MQLDFFGHNYDETIAPAFVRFDIGNDAERLVYHRATARLMDFEKVKVAMEDAGYVPEVGEIGLAERWLGDHTA